MFLFTAIHAREWIAPATATYMMNEIITKPNNYWDIVDNFDFYFIPVLNPDGYRFTFDSNRLWRKSRSENNSPVGCLGVDINRNFGKYEKKACKRRKSIKKFPNCWLKCKISDFQWNSCAGCSSGDPCSATFRGLTPFSESEGDHMRAFIMENSDVNWQYYVSFHSYSQVS